MLGFIVEGHMEAGIVGQICGAAQIRRLQINGQSFPVERICERVYPHTQLLRRKGVQRIILIIDREQRDISSEDFEQQIYAGLERRGADISMITVASPDRNFETWILPFLTANCDIGHEAREECEGRNGKSIIRERFRARGTAYVEVVDGVKLFKRVNSSKLATISPSFSRLRQRLDVECWWLERE